MTEADAKRYIEWFEKNGRYYFLDDNGDTITRKDCEDFLASDYYKNDLKLFVLTQKFSN